MKGFYRSYFHIGGLGFKFARISFNDGNPFIGFLTSCIMNWLEYKRYRYYCLRVPMRQWGRKWQYKGKDVIFCPVYFSCGLFSIVKHLDKKVTDKTLMKWVDMDLEKLKLYDDYKHYKSLKPNQRFEDYLNYKTNWMCQDIKADNFRVDSVTGELYCIDYGYFTLGNTHSQCACLIDYQ